MRFLQTKYVPAVMVVLVLTMTLVMASVTSIRVGNPPPEFKDLFGNTSLPEDGGHGPSEPVHFGEVVEFKATATDLNGDDYYLAVCKTDQIIPQNFAPPACADGAWAVSGLVSSGDEAQVTFIVDETARLKNDWYAFVCDLVAADSKCSSPNQGEGDLGSPFYTFKQVGALRFGAENCPDLAEVERLTPDPSEAEKDAITEDDLLTRSRSRRELKRLLRTEILKEEDEEVEDDLEII